MKKETVAMKKTGALIILSVMSLLGFLWLSKKPLNTAGQEHGKAEYPPLHMTGQTITCTEGTMGWRE
jgi:hypothetical protein